MSALYDATMFLAIALLAILVPIFVFAVSLLGRALQRAAEEQQEIEVEEQQALDSKIENAQKELEKVKKTGGELTALRSQLEEYEKTKKDSEKKSKRVLARYQLLAIRGGVLHPALFFLISLALTSIAKAVGTGWLAPLLWVASLLALAWACYQIYKCLTVVQKVAVTTEEIQFKRMTAALSLALERHEEKKRPKMSLTFKKRQPPFVFAPATEEVIEFNVWLKRGDVAKSTEVWFFAAPTFEFPGVKTWRQAETFILPNAMATKFTMGDLLAGRTYLQELTIKTPSQKDKYTLWYQLMCEGFVGEHQSFAVKVE